MVGRGVYPPAFFFWWHNLCVTVFNIPGDWPVFILEDSRERIQWFRERVPQAAFAKTADEALSLLAGGEFKVIFLDHDLSYMDAAHPERLHGNGKEVARYLARTKFQGLVVIHSVNEAGAAAMKAHLKDARVAPFGSFEIE